jgi:heme/copper-type cytochrome/quinol oxidase subunit 2
MILGAALVLFAGAIVALLSARRQSESGAKARLPHPLLVEARGRGREWQFTYGGADGVLGSDDDVITRRHFRVPAGVEVLIQLRSDDYIYVFSCPDLTIKEIAVPDLSYEIRFRARDPMCGFRLQPGGNMGTLEVTSERAFRSWFTQLEAIE